MEKNQKNKNFCRDCGNELQTDFLFCDKCGVRRKSANNDTEKTIDFKIPGFFKKTICFSNSSIKSDGYGEREIYYKDVKGLSYHVIKKSVNFVPMGTFYYITIEGNEGHININFDSSGEGNILFSQILHVVEKVVKPYLLSTLLNTIEKERKLNIGSLSVTRDGLWKRRIFMKDDFMSWEDYDSNNMFKGFLNIYKKDIKRVDQNRLFCSISLSKLNTVILPELIYFLSGEYEKNKNNTK